MRALLLILCLMLCSCSRPIADQFFLPHHLDFNPPPGPPEYQQGWKDGCESGIAAYTTAFVKAFQVYKLKQDPQLVRNPVYYQIWKDAYLYCALYFEGVNKYNI